MKDQNNEINQKQIIEVKYTEKNKWLEREVKAKDILINEQRDIIMQLKSQLESFEDGQDRQRDWISRLRDKLKDNQTKMNSFAERRAKSRENCTREKFGQTTDNRANSSMNVQTTHPPKNIEASRNVALVGAAPSNLSDLNNQLQFQNEP